jgi:hypothetical protein
VFTPPLNTIWRRDLNKNIPDSIENRDGVMVFREFWREEIIFWRKGVASRKELRRSAKALNF